MKSGGGRGIHCWVTGEDGICPEWTLNLSLEGGYGRPCAGWARWRGVRPLEEELLPPTPSRPQAATSQAWERGPGPWLSCPEHGRSPIPRVRASCHIPSPTPAPPHAQRTWDELLRGKPLPQCQGQEQFVHGQLPWSLLSPARGRDGRLGACGPIPGPRRWSHRLSACNEERSPAALRLPRPPAPFLGPVLLRARGGFGGRHPRHPGRAGSSRPLHAAVPRLVAPGGL